VSRLSTYSVMPLLSTMIGPNFELVASETVFAPVVAAVVVGAGVVVVAAFVVWVVFELVPLELLEHAARVSAASAAAAANRIVDLRIETSLEIGFPARLRRDCGQGSP
jgi:hypothetical protein